MPLDKFGMTASDTAPDHMIGSWQRYDWRESFFAPGMFFLQALVSGGKTASGIGRNRQSAFLRCLGETAEILALAATPDLEWSPLRDGIAAQLGDRSAKRAAMLEAFERVVLMQWWQGRRSALPVTLQWQVESGLQDSLGQARSGAALRRKTRFWQVATDPTQPVVMICQSTSAEGQDPLLGFGCDTCPKAAAAKALRELLLMEMNLMELLALRGTDRAASCAGLQAKMLTYARRCPTLLADAPEVTPARADPLGDPVLGIDVTLLDLTREGIAMRVWMCRPDLPLPISDSETGFPFL